MLWGITGRLILKVLLSCRAASPQLLIWMSVFYVSPGSLINSAGFKMLCCYLWLTSSLSVRRSPTPLTLGKLRRALRVFEVNPYAHLWCYSETGPGEQREIRNERRSRGMQTDREAARVVCMCQTACWSLFATRRCTAGGCLVWFLRPLTRFYSVCPQLLEEPCHFLFAKSRTECGRLGGAECQISVERLEGSFFFCLFLS